MNPGSNSHEYSAINVTPMIDVLLVLLIVFMAIAPRKTTGLDVLVPRESNGSYERAPENPVILEIAADGTLRLNSQRIEVAALGVRLTDIFSRRGDRVMFLRGAGELEFGAVATVIDIARGANVDRVALLSRL